MITTNGFRSRHFYKTLVETRVKSNIDSEMLTSTNYLFSSVLLSLTKSWSKGCYSTKMISAGSAILKCKEYTPSLYSIKIEFAVIVMRKVMHRVLSLSSFLKLRFPFFIRVWIFSLKHRISDFNITFLISFIN